MGYTKFMHDLPNLKGCPVALDIECKDTRLKDRGSGWAYPDDDGGILGVSVATKDKDWYFPIRHPDTANYPVDAILDWVEDTCAESPRIVTHGGMYDMGWLKREDVRLPTERMHDTLAQAALLDEYKYAYGLDVIAQEQLGVKTDYTLLQEECKRRKLKGDARGHLWKLPGTGVVSEYGRRDARRTFDCDVKMAPQIVAQDLTRIYELERSLMPILVDMRTRGVRVDVSGAEEAAAAMRTREKELQSDLYRQTGFRLESPWLKDELAKFFDAAGIKYKLTPKTKKPSITGDWLEEQTHPICAVVKEWRELEKTRGTFIDGYVLGHAVNGRIFPELVPLPSDEGGAVSGRFSSCNPNIQNLPSLNETIKKLVRGLFLPEEGSLWAALDYSQQEPRLAVHYASVANVHGAWDAVRAYHQDPNTDFHTFVANLTGLPRKIAKIINLALMYGMGGAKLCHDLGLPTKWIEGRDGQMREVAGDEGQAILDQYHAKMPFVQGLKDECERRAKRHGYIMTLGGRRCRFGAEDNIHFARRRAFPYKALNRLIQGSAADQIKMAMVELVKQGMLPLVQVHDEIGLPVPDLAYAERGAEIMRDIVPLRVPMRVDVEIGESWGKAA